MKLITLSKEVKEHIDALIRDKKAQKLEQLADYRFLYDGHHEILKYALEVLATKDGVCAVRNGCLFIGKSEEEINKKILSVSRKKVPKATIMKMVISRLRKVDDVITGPFKIMKVDDIKEAEGILCRGRFKSKDDFTVYGLVDLVRDHNLTDEDIVNARNLMFVQGVLEE